MGEIALPARARPRVSGASADVARYERIWRTSYAAVHAHAARRVGAARADEVCAEVFLTAWRRLAGVPRDELPWLLATSRKVIGTLWRGDERRSRLHDRLEQQPAPGPEPATLGLDPDLSRALEWLDELDRDLLLLVQWEGLSPSRSSADRWTRPAHRRSPVSP